MGRRSQSRSLAVWANGLRVGRWLLPTSGAMEFAYEPDWVGSAEARPLSLSLPMNLDGLPIKGERVGYFFDNLLPDSEAIRRRLQERFRVVKDDAFHLLTAVGRDCVGALQFLPEDETPGAAKIQVTPLDEAEVEQMLLQAVSQSSPLGAEEEPFRISLAGAQEKTAFTWHRGRWGRPHGTTPTTHIFKLPLGVVGGQRLDLSTSLENEWLCAQILREFGVPIAACDLQHFGSTKTLVVTRFDRRLHSSRKYWLRLPQEDLCQATGTPSSLKYEADGGPGISAVASILRGSEERNDLATFLRAQLLFWMLAATDGHAKNFSLRLLPMGRYCLTPLYDVLSAWPYAGSRHDQVHPKKLRLAMAWLGTSKHYRVHEIVRRHFNMTARACGLGADMELIADEVIAKTPLAIDRVGKALPKGFPARVFDAVTTGLQRAASSLQKMAPM